MMPNSIKALHLFHEYLNITENWAFRLINNLPDTDIVIAAPLFKKNNFYPSDFRYLEFPIKTIETDVKKPSISLYNKFASAMLLFYPYYVKTMSGKVDLMHSHFSLVAWKYRTIAKQLKIPHIVSFYGFDYEWLPFNQPIWKTRYKILFRDADMFICEGGHGARILESIGCPKEKIRICRLGVDIDNIFLYRRKKRREELKLLQIATFSGKKGHLYTVEAFAATLIKCPNMSLTIAGRNNEGIKEKIEFLLDRYGMKNKVELLESIELEQLYEFMNNYHVFIHPSCYTDDRDCEGGAPVVLLDAQATGMPIISTYHCDIPEVVVHQKTGLLTTEKNVDDLSKAIMKFYFMEQEEYDQYCENARHHVGENYNIKNSGKNLKKIYDDILLHKKL